MILLARDGDVIRCEESQVAVFELQGYQRTVPAGESSIRLSQVASGASESQSHAIGSVCMTKNGQELHADPGQVAVFEASGWRVVGSEPAAGPTGVTSQSDLRTALAGLDPEAESDWTQDHQPRLAVLKEILGHEASRAQIAEAWPGFSRDALRVHQQQ